MEHPDVSSSSAPAPTAASSSVSSPFIPAASAAAAFTALLNGALVRSGEIQVRATEVRRESAGEDDAMRLDERSTSDLGLGPDSVAALGHLLEAPGLGPGFGSSLGLGVRQGQGPRPSLAAPSPQLLPLDVGFGAGSGAGANLICGEEGIVGRTGAGSGSRASSVRSASGSGRGSVMAAVPVRVTRAGSSSGPPPPRSAQGSFSGRGSVLVPHSEPDTGLLEGLGVGFGGGVGVGGGGVDTGTTLEFEPPLGQGLEWRDYKASIELESVRVLRELERELRVSNPAAPAPMGPIRLPQPLAPLSDPLQLSIRGASAFGYPTFRVGAPQYAYAGSAQLLGQLGQLETGSGPVQGLGMGGPLGRTGGGKQRDAPDNKSVGSSKRSAHTAPADSARDSGIAANERSSTSTLVADGALCAQSHCLRRCKCKNSHPQLRV